MEINYLNNNNNDEKRKKARIVLNSILDEI